MMSVTKDGLKHLLSILCIITSLQTIADPKHQLPISDLKLFVDVYHQVRERYVNDITDKKLLELAIEGMLQNLDPHSDFLSQKEYKELKSNTSGEFAGLGFEVMLQNDYIKVITAIDNTPAARAGIQTGDLIIKINDLSLQGLKMKNALDLLEGKKGTTINLTIARKGVEQPLNITLTREIIKIESVTGQLITDDYGYLKINQFQKRTAYDAEKKLKKIKKINKRPLKGLIIDLRNNPGGLLTSATSLADLFLTKGIITYTVAKQKQQKDIFYATPVSIMNSTAIILLVNGGSASASEVFAGALQDHNRAIIAGTRTFGKGSIQSILPLPEGRALKLTTAKYFTPSGRSIQAQGIEPNIIIEPAKLTVFSDDPLFKEAQLNGHLEKSNNTAIKKEKLSLQLKLKDYQLYEALNLIKAMTFQPISPVEKISRRPNK